jgi:hypothetical protein
MSYKLIQDTLDTVLSGLSGMPLILHENESGKGCDGYYMRTTLLPAKTETRSVGETGWDRFFGLYQIDLFYPIDESPDAANFMADKIIDAYPKKTILTSSGINIRIVQYWREVRRKSETKHQVPVFIEWEYWKLRS